MHDARRSMLKAIDDYLVRLLQRIDGSGVEERARQQLSVAVSIADAVLVSSLPPDRADRACRRPKLPEYNLFCQAYPSATTPGAAGHSRRKFTHISAKFYASIITEGAGVFARG